ncbi:nucleotidyltransferase [Cytobacillus firmus]|uniref:nucleotidyltransferase n=1 Tax=Cytobacillus firmus TaxID=1399 RepID=UPI0024C1B947|nr:nucleotidyltransferase [Cytobacillus firmus]WHY60384.1 nucleotidyltransferase [Cytobacillus firmus]
MSLLTMFDLEKKFTSFYTDCVKLSDQEINSLREKKRINIDRLRDGLSEYNDENNAEYKIMEIIEQGSVAMRTVTQHDQKEYDIDVAVVFDSSNIPDDTKKVKSFIEDALQRKCKQFKASPKAKTNAVTLEYASGYHIDFAIYRRTLNFYDSSFEYEHCGSEWRSRDPKAINKWFKEENDGSDKNVRRVVRLLKMFCKSNPGWLMPGGLVQSILVAERIQIRDRLDEMFFETIKSIKERLDYNKEILNPVTGQSILYNKKDEQKVKNLCSRLGSGIEKLSVLFNDNCTEDNAMNAWKNFFNHKFWGEDIQKSFSENAMLEARNEELLRLTALVNMGTGDSYPLGEFEGRLPKGCSIYFQVDPLVPYTKVEWIVHNYGDEAEGDLYHKKEGRTVVEHTKYRGNHTMTCKVYEGGRVLAQKVIPVNIR